jgi:ATP-dependent helicase/nuclease subunit B
MQELSFVVQELWEELSAGQFEPVDFELGFGDDGKMPAIEVPSRKLRAQLIGYVDRVDSFRVGEANFFRVVDYKTGKKEFNYCDVFNGVGLQMLLYLFALEQEGQDILGSKPIPAGVQYFPARVPYIGLDGAGEDETAERRKIWKRQGLLLNDELALKAMDPEEDMPRLSCKRKKDGMISGDLADRQQLKKLQKYVFGLLGKMVDEIASGQVAPNPYTRGKSHSACDYCPYGSVCRKESVEGRRNYKSMSPQWFWEEIEKEDRHGG